jgi:hypothetical protein
VKPASYWQQVREVEQRATKGEWLYNGNSTIFSDDDSKSYPGGVVAEVPSRLGGGDIAHSEQQSHDADFIALSREALPAALDQIDEQARETERLIKALETINEIGSECVFAEAEQRMARIARTALRKP